MRAPFLVIVCLVTAHTQGDHEDLEYDYINDVVEGSGRSAASVIKCYKCAVMTLSGCEETVLSKNRDEFTVQCAGQCLNLTAGIHASYDCTENNGHSNYCIENDGTRICVCNTNYCNGPQPAGQYETDIDFEVPSLKPPLATMETSKTSAREQILLELENNRDGLSKAHEFWEMTTQTNSCSLYFKLEPLIILSTIMNIYRFVP